MMPTKLSADDPIQIFGTEPPQYAALRRELESAWAATSDAFLTLRSAWFGAVGLAEEGDQPERLTFTERKEELTQGVIEAFMRTMAGQDRSPLGFASNRSEDGVLQQAIWSGYAAGAVRAREQTEGKRGVGADGEKISFTETVRARLLTDAFARLSESSRLRFEARLEEILRAMIDGFERGLSPVEIARRLGTDLDGYWRGRLLTIVRTEIGLAAMHGQMESYREIGVQRVEVIGNPTTDALCVSRIGRKFSIDDTDNLPLYHPNCLCDIVPLAPI